MTITKSTYLSLSIAIAGLLTLSDPAEADPILATDVIANWTTEESPARGLLDGDFSLSGSQLASANVDVSRISNFDAILDFVFSARITPIGDNDTIGLLFGYQDSANHYRLGLEAGGSPDGPSSAGAGGTDARGLWFVSEQSGVGSLLFNDALSWSSGASYDFTVSRVGDFISFDITLVGFGSIASSGIDDTTFMNGSIGIFVESQTARFDLLDFTDTAEDGVPVPEPGTLALLGIGLAGMGLARRRRKV